jgi:lipid-A-disaccharide synthase
MSYTIFISAGEASGEHYGALLISALEKRLAAAGETARFFGMGGTRMAAAGLEVAVRSEDMAVMGLTEVVRHLPGIYREYRRLKMAIRQRRPDVAILIDFPEIHFRLAREFKRLGVPVIFFVSPQLWAWKKKRIKLVQQFVDKMLVIFPFEEPFYQERGVAAEFVGHPLADLPAPSTTRNQFALENKLDPAKTWIGLLPGSRPKEIRDHMPEMLNAACKLTSREPQAQQPPERFEFLVPLAATLNTAQRGAVQDLVDQLGYGLDIRLVNDARAALFHCRVSVVASGTATVEAALIGNPFVVVYHVSPVTYAIAKRIVTVPHVAMANLIAGKRVVTELIQDDFTAANIIQEVERLLPDGGPRQSMMQELAAIRGSLNHRLAGPMDEGGAIGRVAEITLKQLGVPLQSQMEAAGKP